MVLNLLAIVVEPVTLQSLLALHTTSKLAGSKIRNEGQLYYYYHMTPTSLEIIR